MDFTGEVHPVAALFPMMAEDELRELADDIRENGLLHPIVLDSEGALIDGRNRLRACQMAGVEPRYTALNGHDPVAFILSSNVNRRHLNAGQRAMAVALVYPEPGKGGRGKKTVTSGDSFSREHLSRAREVVRWGKDDLAPAVMSGTKTLNQVHEEAVARREAAQSDEARLTRLQAEAPDLAQRVVEGDAPLSEAWGAFMARLRDREQDERDRYAQRERTTRAVATGINAINVSISVDDPHTLLDGWVHDANPFPSRTGFRQMWTPAGLRDTAARLEALAEAIEKRQVSL